MSDRLVIGAPQWIVPTALLAGVLASYVVYSYVRTRSIPSIRTGAALAKIIAIGCIAWCLLEPLWSGQRPRPQANLLTLLVDNSESMTISPAKTPDIRRKELRQTLAANSAWRTRLAQDFDVRTYAFDSRLRGWRDAETLDFQGDRSALGSALVTLGERFANRPMAGLVLFSDGNATDLTAQDTDFRELGLPVYPVRPRSAGAMRDVRVHDVIASQSDFETTPVTLDVQVAANGMAGEELTVRLYDDHDVALEERTVPSPANGDLTNIRFRFRPQQVGTQFYQVLVAATDELDDVLSGHSAREATVTNNRHWVAVHRRRGPYRVLYLSGRPNWEFKFLRRSLQEDTEMELVGLIRIAKEAPKFTFRDQKVGSSNPLFEGLGASEEESAEQRDQPVLLRVGVKDQEELQSGFPVAADELFRYDAVVLDDIEAKFFTQDQMLMLRRFVSDRGGGLLLLGGPDSFARRGYETTPIAEMAPVYANREPREEPVPAAKLTLTRDGWLQPWMRLRSTEIAERERLDEMPAFATWNRVDQVKPGATILATLGAGNNEESPGFVIQRFGSGRCAALLAGDLWRWDMHRKPDDAHDLGQAWRQWLRWLTSDVPRRVEAEIQSTGAPDDPVEIVVTVRNEEFKPYDNADIQLTLTPPAGEPITLPTTSSVEAAGVYVASYWPHETGGYRVQATVRAPDSAEIGEAEAGWVSAPAAAEYRRLDPHLDRLTRLAEATGGEVIDEDSLDEFVASLPTRSVPVTENWVYPLWHHPWVLSLALLGLCTEWGLRRWKGLP